MDYDEPLRQRFFNLEVSASDGKHQDKVRCNTCLAKTYSVNTVYKILHSVHVKFLPNNNQGRLIRVSLPSQQAFIELTVNDANDNPPEFLRPFIKPAPVPESVPPGHVIAHFEAKDKDTGVNARFK